MSFYHAVKCEQCLMHFEFPREGVYVSFAANDPHPFCSLHCATSYLNGLLNAQVAQADAG